MKRIAPEISARVDCLIGNPQNIGRRGRFFYLVDNRHNQMQSNAATMRATQLSSIEITCVATITFACLKRRTACPIAIIPKMTDATRKPVLCEFMPTILTCRSSLCQQKTLSDLGDRSSPERCRLHDDSKQR